MQDPVAEDNSLYPNGDSSKQEISPENIDSEVSLNNQNKHSIHDSSHRSTSNLYTFPKLENGPVGSYYSEIRWEGKFNEWNLVRISTPMDGSCLFHAITNSFFAPYHKEILNGERMSRREMIKSLRKDLAQKLESKISDDQNAPRHYDVLNNGNTSIFSKDVPEFSLDYMKQQLDSDASIGYGYIEFIGNALNKDIYIIDASRRDIYVTDDLSFTIKGNRNSIVLYYMNGHYELIGIRNDKGGFDTHFIPSHSFIRFLYDRVQSLIH